MQYPDNPSF